MKRNKALAILFFAIVLVGSSLTLLIPQPPNAAQLGANFHVSMFVSAGTALSFVSAGIWFMLGFAGFTDRLKQVYGVVCLGLVAFGLSQVQIPVLIVTNQVDSTYAKAGIIAIPILVALASLLFGMRLFARLMGVKNIFASLWFVPTASIALAVGFMFLPHFGQSSQELVFDANLAAITLATAISAGCAVLALQIKLAANVTYASAMAWLFVGFGSLVVVGIHYIFALIVLGDLHWYTLSGVLLANYMLVGLLFMCAAYAFNAIKGQAAVNFDAKRNFFGRPREVKMVGMVSSLDIVMYTAQLVSSPLAINDIMDRVRELTGTQAPGTQLPPQTIIDLKEIYLALEQYLTHDEPIRKFTQQSLRDDIQTKLSLATNVQPTFWPQLNRG